MKIYKLKEIDFRVPEPGDLYIDKNGRVQRCKEPRRFSKHAQSRRILKELAKEIK